MSQNSAQSEIKTWMQSLGGKFILLIVSVVSIAMGIIGTLHYQSESAYGLALLKTKGETLGHFMAAVSAEPILAYDFVTLNDYVRDVSKENDIIYTVITAPDGSNFASHLNKDNEFIRQARGNIKNDVLIGIVENLSKEPRVLNVTTDIIFNENIIGKVIVGLDRRHAELAAHAALRQQFVNNVVLLLVLMTSIYVVFRYSTLHPLRQLMKGARRIAHGDLDEDVAVTTNDEMGDLARTFNVMMRNLKSNINEKDSAFIQVKNLNQTLENRVAERTSALQVLNHELQHLALHDPLTELPNRTLIQDRLGQSVREANRCNRSFAVFMIDLDRFKEVNDTLGHDAGDQLLLQVSQRLLDVLRDVDTVGRLGGDEFAILVDDVNIDSSIIVVNKIRQAFEKHFTLEQMSLSTSASIGVAIYPEHGDSPQALLKSADVAMYVAKQQKEEYCIYHPSKDFHTEQRLSLVGDLREAIAENHLRLFYQPKIDLKQQRVVGVEALVRWEHPEKGMIFPDDFIPLAEQTGLIKSLTQWVLEKALSDLQGWNTNNIDISIAVNLSAQNLQDTQLTGYISDLLKQYKTLPGRLVLEVTETALMHNTEEAIETLNKLKRLGVFLSIDDFGVGYSSFSYLKRLPVDDIKIDKSFIMDMAKDIDDAVIVESIISLAHHLGLQVVAEGVENNTVMKQLVKWNCDMAQGYYISRPIPENELMEFIQRLGSHMNYPISNSAVASI